MHITLAAAEGDEIAAEAVQVAILGHTDSKNMCPNLSYCAACHCSTTRDVALDAYHYLVSTAICIQRPIAQYVMGGGWDLFKQ